MQPLLLLLFALARRRDSSEQLLVLQIELT